MKNYTTTVFSLISVLMMVIFAIYNDNKTLTINKWAATPSESIKKYMSYYESSSPSYPEFNTSGLNYEMEFTDIFIGNFEDVRLQRKSLFFNILFGSYISAFARHCADYLPSDKIELTERVCVSKTVTKNGYGMVINSHCTQWETRGLDIYADPKMYQVMMKLNQHQLSNMLSIIANGEDGLGFAAKMTGEMKMIEIDMAKLFKLNTCNSPGLKRFQENLKLFALGQKPIQIESLIAQRKSNKVELSSSQDIQQLVEDLVYQNSQQWNFNRYEKGSVKDIKILASDASGRPAKVKAAYKFTGFTGNKQGTVILTFTAKGLPDCLYFFDFPTTCRSANRKIVNNYATNAYAISKPQVPILTSSGKPHQVQAVNKTIKSQKLTDVPFAVVEDSPIFPGCESLEEKNEKKTCFSEKLNEFIHEKFNTKLFAALGLFGVNRIIVQFKIDQQGYINNIQVRTSHPGLEAEALRVIKLLPRMTPGKYWGMPVGVMYSFPLSFKVAEEDNIEAATFQKVGKNQNYKVKKPNQKAKNYSKAKMRQLFNLEKSNGGDGNF